MCQGRVVTGLRAKHRADRDGRILDAAAGLFRDAGYEGAKIEAIAAQAEVSVGTIYNYYRNKGDILVAIVSMEVNEVLNAGRGVIASPPLDVGDAIDTLVGIYIEHSLHYLSKEMWRQAMAISTQQPDSPFGQTYSSLDRALTGQIRELIARMQELELVDAEVDGRTVGELLFNNMNMMFIEFVKDDATRISDLRADLRRQNRILVAAITRRADGLGDERNGESPTG
jgi:AcrR family transcriptional regulator